MKKHLILISGIMFVFSSCSTHFHLDFLGQERLEEVTLLKSPVKEKILVIDIDGFKEYNDTYGHPAGDKLLKDLGILIRHSIRRSDIAFRYGGDEFAIMCPECSIECAKCTAKKLSDIVATHSFREEGSSTLLKITISCGVATYSKGMKDLVAEADKYLYEAKIAGKGRIAG